MALKKARTCLCVLDPCAVPEPTYLTWDETVVGTGVIYARFSSNFLGLFIHISHVSAWAYIKIWHAVDQPRSVTVSHCDNLGILVECETSIVSSAIALHQILPSWLGSQRSYTKIILISKHLRRVSHCYWKIGRDAWTSTASFLPGREHLTMSLRHPARKIFIQAT